MQLLGTSVRYFHDSRTGGPDGDYSSDDGDSVADQFVTTTPAGQIARVDDYFTASLGGRAAIRNTMVRGDLHSRRFADRIKPKTYIVDERLRTVVGMERADNGDSSSSSTNQFCRRNCPFGRACHKRVMTPVCMACFDVVRSDERAAVQSKGPPVVMNGGFAIHRGSFLFKLHKDAYMSKDTRASGHLVYDPVAILAEKNIAVDGADTGRHVCEGYAAFIFGYYRNAGVWFTMRKRNASGKQWPYDDYAKKRAALRVAAGTSLLAPEYGGLDGARAAGDGEGDDGEGGVHEDGDFAGADTDDDEAALNSSPNKRKKKRNKRTELIRVGESDLRARVTTWMVHWGGKVGDKMPVGPGSIEQRFVFPTTDIAQVHHLLRLWCRRNELPEYWVEIDQFKKWFNENKLVKLSRKKGNFKCCDVCLGRANELATCMPCDEPRIREKYHTHLFQQETLRYYYYSCIVKSIDGALHGSDLLEITIIYDFMDQAKTACPHFRKDEVPKNCEGGNQRVFRIMGVKVHGYGTFLYYVDETLPGGANITCTILTDVMRRIYDIAPAVRNILVHVQADNCSENKNKVVFAVQHAMCHTAFRERGVKVRFENNYLMVNHTHEDIDQLFKLIADLLRHEDTITFAELKAVVGQLKVKAGHFLEQIDVPCAYDFSTTFEPSVDKEFRYYMTGKHQLCVFWDAEKDRCGFEYKFFPWYADYHPSYGMTTLRGKEFDKMPAIRSNEPAWIPSPLEPMWAEGCKPERVARHCEHWHKEIPGRVSAEHVRDYKAWAATESAEAIRARYATMAKFVWPLPKPCPAIDPAAPRIYARGERPQADIDQEANPTDFVSHGGPESQYRAAQGAADRRAARVDDAAIAEAQSEGNNKIVVDDFYFIHWTQDDAPDELLFTLVKAKKVPECGATSGDVQVSLGSHTLSDGSYLKYSDNLLDDLTKAKFRKELRTGNIHKTYDMARACICADKVKVTKSTPIKILGGQRQTVELKRIERDLKAAHKNWYAARRLALAQEAATAAVAGFHTGVVDHDSANTSETAFV